MTRPDLEFIPMPLMLCVVLRCFALVFYGVEEREIRERELFLVVDYDLRTARAIRERLELNKV